MNGSGTPSSCALNQFVTWEIVGDIKTIPEDFIVREIGWAPSPLERNGDNDIDGIRHNSNNCKRRPGPEWKRKIAGSEMNDTTDGETRRPTLKIAKAAEALTPETSLGSLAKSQTPPEALAAKPMSQQVGDETNVDDRNFSNPAEELRRILIQCHSETPDTKENHADNTLKQMTELQKWGLEKIHQDSATSNDKLEGEKVTWVPTSQLFTSSSASQMTSKADWRLLHR